MIQQIIQLGMIFLVVITMIAIVVIVPAAMLVALHHMRGQAAEQAIRLACDVADEAIVLHLGRIAMRGPATEIRDNPDLKRLYLGE